MVVLELTLGTVCAIVTNEFLFLKNLTIDNPCIILTGTAVGVISIIGYTPDIFSGPLIGYFIDKLMKG